MPIELYAPTIDEIKIVFPMGKIVFLWGKIVFSLAILRDQYFFITTDLIRHMLLIKNNNTKSTV